MISSFRWMIRRDIQRVCEIDYEANAPYWWLEKDFRDLLKRRDMIGKVIEDRGNKIEDRETRVGFVIYGMRKHSLEIVRLVVAPDYQRRGFGSAMLTKIKKQLTLNKRTAISVQVDDDNLTAQQFLAANGFRAVSDSDGRILFRFVRLEVVPG